MVECSMSTTMRSPGLAPHTAGSGFHFCAIPIIWFVKFWVVLVFDLFVCLISRPVIEKPPFRRFRIKSVLGNGESGHKGRDLKGMLVRVQL